ncbi:putative bifunctional diguanylate cyclase/phosphodiesterase [Hydrogenimonas sp.]
MWRRGNFFLFPYQILYILVLLVITGVTIFFYRSIDTTFQKVSDQFIQSQLAIVEDFSKNIERRIEAFVPAEPLETLQTHEALKEHIDNILSLFSTSHFRYVYLLYLDDRGRLRYLADGSYETGERGMFMQKFDPETETWKKALQTGEPEAVIQKDFTGLWITFYYPLHIWKESRYLLVFDVSIETLEGFRQILQPIRNLLKTMSAILLALLFSSIAWSTLFYFQRKKNSLDPLTRLFNRNIIPQIKRRVDLANSAIVLADIDHFKRINDRYGHDAGDMVLQFLGRVLLQSTRPEDILVRYGGEEFLIILNGVAGEQEVRKILRRITETLARQHATYDGQNIPVQLSMGVVVQPAGMELEEAILKADKMLYIAKTTGRNRAVFEGDESKKGRRLLFDEVKEMLENGGLYFEYQPIVRSKNLDIVKYEVLVRLEDENGTVHYPGEFLPAIHNTGLYRNLTKELLHMAFEIIHREGIRLSINFDINDFHDETIFEIIVDELKRSKMLARKITVELLEEHMIENIDAMVQKIERLKELGITIAIDDFGKGYAGLEYLLRFQPRIIKVDKSIVQDVFNHPHLEAILTSIVATCHAIGIEVVAEGVENERIMKKMQELGFDYLQGYYLGRPAKQIVKTLHLPAP